MYHAANMWIRKPTPRITPSMTSDRPSRRSENSGVKPSTLIHVHSFTVCCTPSGGFDRNWNPMRNVSSADKPTEPTPTTAAAVSGMRPRANASATKPASGNAKTSGRRSSISRSSVHLSRRVDVERLEAAEDLQQEREAHARLRCCERQDEDEHDLPVFLD